MTPRLICLLTSFTASEFYQNPKKSPVGIPTGGVFGADVFVGFIMSDEQLRAVGPVSKASLSEAMRPASTKVHPDSMVRVARPIDASKLDSQRLAVTSERVVFSAGLPISTAECLRRCRS
jgi:hypothetical protein